MDSFVGVSPHRPLSPSDPSEIRLVKLFPGELDDQIRCELQHVSLATRPVHDYIALSYTWGDPKVCSRIFLDGAQYPVTANLHSFLRHAQRMLLAVSQKLSPETRQGSGLLVHNIVRQVLQNPEFSHHFPFETDDSETNEIIHRGVARGISYMRQRYDSLGSEETIDGSQDLGLDCCHLYLWIDALCINQQDLGERSQQVSRMKEIYDHAASLFIWLGEPTKYPSDITAALRLIQEMEQLARERFYIFFGDEDEDNFAFDLTEYLNHVTAENFANPRLGAVNQVRLILRHDWFTRAWIIQELASARSDVSAWIGFTQVPWRSFCDFIALACYRMMDSSSPTQKSRFTLDMRNLLRLRRVWNSHQEVQELVATGASSPTADATGRFAHTLKALLQQTSGAFDATDPRDRLYALLGLVGPWEIPDELRPDYQLPIERVFHQYASFLLRYTKDVRILDCGAQRITGAASWVPDWRLVNFFGSTTATKRKPLMVGAPYVEFSPDLDEMAVEGVILGRVEFVVHSTAISRKLEELKSYKDEPEDVALVQEHMRAIMRAFQELKSLCLQRLRGLLLEIFLDKWKEFWRWLCRFEQDAAVIEVVLAVLEGELEFCMDHANRAMTQLLAVETDILYICQNGIAVLESGGIVNIIRIDEPICSGDVICMLKGALRPTVIRPVEKHFTFVGSCWVTSFQLEDPDESFYDGFPAERICLR
ncbi:heterokaryon incompatibility protein-domain-containing protein [Apodospora peruviana]|uniref:Heterokaryon incompatibility protein-domain-containing protein n=1 Tax=Apodospora peruviana TaxID=516989 RepID=A0AAE0HV25_9PEZI|nr:heterokaryon incompatibility protein-domain-containing protein [Apodospora peruviana]